MAPDRVDEAFAAVARADFLPEDQRGSQAADRPLPIGHGQTNSQPTTVANMLRLLDARPGHRVLDVGSGSGWTTALLGHLVGPEGSVSGVELEPELARWGGANVARQGMPWARVHEAQPGVLGWPDDAPFDRILVSAQAGEMPHALVDQLAGDGVMVAPVAGRMLLVVREGDGLRIDEHGRYRFVPLR